MTVGQWLLAFLVVAFFVWIAASMFWGIANAPRAWETSDSSREAECIELVDVLEVRPDNGPWDRWESLDCASLGFEVRDAPIPNKPSVLAG